MSNKVSALQRDQESPFPMIFADTKQALKQEINSSYTEAPVSSDFEFSVSTYTMNPADELFFQGKLLPLKEKVVTLRDELLVSDDDDEYEDHNLLPRLSKNSGWWKLYKLGMKRNHTVGKKHDNGGLERIDEAKKSVFLNEMFTNINR